MCGLVYGGFVNKRLLTTTLCFNYTCLINNLYRSIKLKMKHDKGNIFFFICFYISDKSEDTLIKYALLKITF